MKSKLFRLGKKDWIKTLVHAIFGAVVNSALNSLQTGQVIDGKALAVGAAIAGLGSIGKNLSTNSDDKVFTKESVNEN